MLHRRGDTEEGRNLASQTKISAETTFLIFMIFYTKMEQSFLPLLHLAELNSYLVLKDDRSPGSVF